MNSEIKIELNLNNSPVSGRGALSWLQDAKRAESRFKPGSEAPQDANSIPSRVQSIWQSMERGEGLIRHVFFHKEHPYHDQKYDIALKTQKNALEKFVKEEHPLNAANVRTLIRKLKTRCDPLSVYLSKALEALIHYPSQSNIRDQNAEYLKFLRKALTSRQYQDKKNDCRPIIHCLCDAKFLKNIMTDYEDKFVKTVIEETEKVQGLHSKKGYTPLYNRLREEVDRGDPEQIAGLIFEANGLLQKAPYDLKKSPQALNWQKFTNTIGVFSDALATSNTSEVRSVHKVSIQGYEREIAYMRHGSVTREPGVGSAVHRAVGKNTVQIIPEYRGFLDSLVVQGKKVLYTNHQDMSKACAECSRGEKIQTLEGDYKDNFFFLSLPNDGPVVKKIGANGTSNWKVDLVSSLVGEKDGFRIPAKLKELPDYETRQKIRFQKIADEIHTLYFPSVPELTEKQRRVFLPIFYFYVKEAVKADCKIDIIVSVCKDNKDRGNASAGIDEFLIELHSEQKNPHSLRDLFVRTLAPFIIKYEHIVPHRLEILLDVLRYVHTLTNDQKKAISRSKILSHFQYKNQKVPH